MVQHTVPVAMEQQVCRHGDTSQVNTDGGVQRRAGGKEHLFPDQRAQRINQVYSRVEGIYLTVNVTRQRELKPSVSLDS